jgi:hypothetical protein
MAPQEIAHMFRFPFEKSSDEIREKCALKIAFLQAKVEDRKRRVAELRERHRITDSVLIDLLQQARAAQKRGESKMSYSTKVMNVSFSSGEEELVVEAGVVNNLLTESDWIDADRNMIRRLELIVRNIRDVPDHTVTSIHPGAQRPTRGHNLSYDELEFLGF